MYRRSKNARLLTGGLVGALPVTTPGDEHWDDVTLLLDGSGGGNSTVPDSSSVNHTVTNVSSGVSNANVTGPYNTTQDVLSFDGTNDKLTVANFSSGGRNFGTGDFTVECWAKCETNESYTTGGPFRTLIENDYGTYQFTGENWFLLDYDFRNSTRLVRFSMSNGSGGSFLTTYAIGSSVDVSDWHHIAAVRSGDTVTLFFDGAAVSTMTAGTDLSDTLNRTLQIGHQSVSGTSRYFKGQLADVRITKGVARYTSNFTPPQASLPTNKPVVGRRGVGTEATLRTRGYLGAAPAGSGGMLTLYDRYIDNLS